MRPRPTLLMLTLLAAVLLGACSRAVRVDSTWTEGMSRRQQFSHVLVVGLAVDYNLRCRYEDRLTANLRRDGVKANSSCSYMNPEDPLTQEGIIPVIQKIGADAVVVTELLANRVDVVEGGSNETRGQAYYKATGYGYAYPYPYYGGFGLPVTYVDFTAEQSEFTLQRSVTVAANLFAVKGAALVLAMRIQADRQKSLHDLLAAVSGAVAERLRDEDVLAAS